MGHTPEAQTPAPDDRIIIEKPEWRSVIRVVGTNASQQTAHDSPVVVVDDDR